MNVDQLLDLARDQMFDELTTMFEIIRQSHLTNHDVVALISILRDPYERALSDDDNAKPAPVLSLVSDSRKEVVK